jgi:hypothetical protein
MNNLLIPHFFGGSVDKEHVELVQRTNMKKSITGVVALLAGAFVAHSQGTVAMNNYTTLAPYMYVLLGSVKIGGAATGPVSPTDTANGDLWTVALYGAAGENDPASSLLPIDTAGGTPLTANLADGTSDGTAGTWYTGVAGVVPGTTGPASSATVQIYAWYNAGGTITSYSKAALAGLPTAFSLTGNVPSLGGGSPPLPAANIPNGMGNINFGIVPFPEPSTMALAVMGASAFLGGLRKKR